MKIHIKGKVTFLWLDLSFEYISPENLINIPERFCDNYAGNWKQWKWKPEMESGNGKRKQSKLDTNKC